MDDDQKPKKSANRLLQSGAAKTLTAYIAISCLTAILTFLHLPARGQGHNLPGNGGDGGQLPPPHIIPISIPTVAPVPTPTPPATIIIPTAPGSVIPPVVVPTDVSNPQITNPNVTSLQEQANIQNMQTLALAGIELISDKMFPDQNKVGKNFDWITVLARHGADFSKPNNYTADLKSGDIIVSVKNPSHLAFVNTPYGDIAIGANSDVMVTFNQGLLRILNFDGEGRVLKVKLDKGPFAGPADPTVTIAPGYELIACDRIITRADMRPKDGIARRFGKKLEKGNMAICQFSLESAAKSIGMLVNLQQTTTGIKERRIITDLSKMAAVLNYKSGVDGYTAEK